MKIKNWNLFEVIWLSCFSAAAILSAIVSKDTIFGLSVLISGVICVVLAAKGNLLTYVFGMYNTLGYAYLAYINGLYGEMGLNLFFFIPMNIVGYFIWKRHTQHGKVEMLHLRFKGRLLVTFICIAGILIMGYFLSLIIGQNSPYVDASTNVLSIVATFLMVKRYKEQWLLYIVLNVLTIFMWVIRAANEGDNSIMMIVMWSAYLINSIYGYYIWSKGAKENIQKRGVEIENNRVNLG